MAKRRVVVLINVKPGADPGTIPMLKKFLLEQFVPAEKEAPGLISIEVDEKYREAIPHKETNDASDLAFIELWESAESNHDWWAGDIFSPKSDRMKEVMRNFADVLQSPEGQYIEFMDYHYTVVD
jgi:hypothetical protein